MRPLVGISISDSPDLGLLGYGTEHLDIVAVRLARALLQMGVDICYGGAFRDKSMTRVLIDLTQAEAAIAEERKMAAPHAPNTNSDDTTEIEGLPVDTRARLVNYQSWPFYNGLGKVENSLTTEMIADTLELIRYVKIDPVIAKTETSLPETFDFGSPRHMLLCGVGLSQMRKAMVSGGSQAVDGLRVQAVSAQLIVAGKMEKWLGALPGLAEETYRALEASKPIYVLGGFGGAGETIGKYLLKESSMPQTLTFDYHQSTSPNFQNVTRGYESNIGIKETHPSDKFNSMIRAFNKVRKNVKNLNNGLNLDENLRLLKSQNLIEICGLIEYGLRNCGVLDRANHLTPRA